MLKIFVTFVLSCLELMFHSLCLRIKINIYFIGSPPSCREVSSNAPSPYYCGTPPRIENANHNGSEDQTYWDLDTELTYQVEDQTYWDLDTELTYQLEDQTYITWTQR